MFIDAYGLVGGENVLINTALMNSFVSLVSCCYFSAITIIINMSLKGVIASKFTHFKLDKRNIWPNPLHCSHNLHPGYCINHMQHSIIRMYEICIYFKCTKKKRGKN